MDVNSKEAMEWSDLMRRNSALEAAIAQARKLILSASVHIPFYGEGRACDAWHKDAKAFLKE
jgi:hypothetical protein